MRAAGREVASIPAGRSSTPNSAALLKGMKRVAMQYSPLCAVPYVAMVDAGTVELVRAQGVEVVSSAELIQEFEACLNDAQFATVIWKPGGGWIRCCAEAFRFIGETAIDTA